MGIKQDKLDRWLAERLRLGGAIRWARQRASLTLTEANAACGWANVKSGTLIGAYEGGKRDIRYSTLLTIADALGVTVKDLVTWVPPEPGAPINGKGR